jgi:pyridoxine/pyridoxamine 5'-phosphate oxidase
MVLINFLYVLPRHSDKKGIIIYNNLQAQKFWNLMEEASIPFIT